MEGRGASLASILETQNQGNSKCGDQATRRRLRSKGDYDTTTGHRPFRAGRKNVGMGMMGLPLEKLPEPAWSDVWSVVRDRLRIEFGQGIFDTWIAPLSFAGADDGHVRLSAPRRLIRDYVATHHAARMERAFAAASQGFVSLDIIAA